MVVNNVLAGIKPLRIAMLTIHSSPIGPLGSQNTGGMSVYVREVAKWIGASHHSVDIFTCSGGASKILDLYPNVRLIHLNWENRSNSENREEIPKEDLLDHLPAIARSLERFAQSHRLKYDMIHSHYWLSGVVGDRVQQQWECPHLTMFHTLGMIKNRTTAGESEPDQRIAHERRLVDAAQGVVVPSHGEQAHLINHYGAPPEKIHLIPCGVNMNRFRPMDKKRARSFLKIDAASLVILFVGRFAPVKGMDVLLEAVAQLVPRYPRLALVVVGGDGPGADSTLALTEQAEDLGVAACLKLAGRIAHDDLPMYYNAADVLALPSFYESFGLVALESLACGTPVAATMTGGASTLIREGRNGTLIRQPDIPSVAQGLDRLLNQVRQRTFSAAKIRESVAGHGWDRIAASILNTYGALLSSV